MPEIANCPFCDCDVMVKRRGNSIRYFVVKCLGCGAEVHGKTEAEAIATWNQRAQPDGCEWEKRQLLDGFGDTHDGYHCSNCGFWSGVEWPYCPKCGAKMSGKRLGE